MIRTRNRSCTGKIRHNSRTEALAHVGRCLAAGAPTGSVDAYACRHCRGWHAGHRGGRRR